MTSSVCRSIDTLATSPVSGSNGGNPETKIRSPARATTDVGAFQFSRYVESGSTRMISRSMIYSSPRKRGRYESIMRPVFVPSHPRTRLFRFTLLVQGALLVAPFLADHTMERTGKTARAPVAQASGHLFH